MPFVNFQKKVGNKSVHDEHPLRYLINGTVERFNHLSRCLPEKQVFNKLGEDPITDGNFLGLGIWYEGFPRQKLVIVGIENGQSPYENEDFLKLEDIARRFRLSIQHKDDHSSLYRRFLRIPITVASIYEDSVHINPKYDRCVELLESLGKGLYGIDVKHMGVPENPSKFISEMSEKRSL